MMIGGKTEIRNREDLYLQIWKDWTRHSKKIDSEEYSGSRQDSFIYIYLKDLNDSMARKSLENVEPEAIEGFLDDCITGSGGQRSNNYRRLEILCAAYARGMVGPDRALFYLDHIVKKDKKTAGSIEKWIRDIRSKVDDETAAKSIFTDEPLELQKYKDRLLYRVINDKFKKYGFITEAETEENYGSEKNEPLITDYRVRSGKKVENLYEDDISMLDAYLSLRGSNGSVSGDDERRGDLILNDSRHKDVCSNSYLKLNANKEEYSEPGDAYIPLGFDPVTGAGIFIIGKNKVSRRALNAFRHRIQDSGGNERKGEREVYYAVVYFGYVDCEDGEGKPYGFDSDCEDYCEDDGYQGDGTAYFKMTLYGDYEDALKGLNSHRDCFFWHYETENTEIDGDILDAIWNRTYRPEPERAERAEEDEMAVLNALRKEEKIAGKGLKRVKLRKAGERPGNVK